MIIDYDFPELTPELLIHIPTSCQLLCYHFQARILNMSLMHLNDIFGDFIPHPIGHSICDTMLTQVLSRTECDHVGLRVSHQPCYLLE